MDNGERGMNPVAMTIINPRKEYWPSRGSNRRPSGRQIVKIKLTKIVEFIEDPGAAKKGLERGLNPFTT